MEWLFENLGLLAFAIFFLLPSVRRIVQRRREAEKKKAVSNTGSNPKKAAAPGQTGQDRRASPAPPTPFSEKKSIFQSTAIPPAEIDRSFKPLLQENDGAYRERRAYSARKRIALLSPLKQAVIWKEILDPPRGL